MKKLLSCLLFAMTMVPFLAQAQTNGNSHYVTEEKSACDAFTWRDGNTYTHDTVVNYRTNDTVYVLLLTVNTSTVNAIDTIAECSFTYGIGSAATTYTHNERGIKEGLTATLKTAAGCDSIVNYTVFFSMKVDKPVQEVITCNPYEWHFRGESNTFAVGSNETFTRETPDANTTRKCDTIHNFHIVVNGFDLGTKHVNSCGSYTVNWGNKIMNDPLNAELENNFTISHDTVLTYKVSRNDHVAGSCDSMYTVNFTFTDKYDTSIISACDSFYWQGIGFKNTTDEPMHIMKTGVKTTDEKNCVTHHTLNLTLANRRMPVVDLVKEVCDSTSYSYINREKNTQQLSMIAYDSVTGKTTTKTNTTPCKYTALHNASIQYNYVGLDAAHCYDSTIILHVSVNVSPISTETVAACDTFRWDKNHTLYSTSVKNEEHRVKNYDTIYYHDTTITNIYTYKSQSLILSENANSFRIVRVRGTESNHISIDTINASKAIDHTIITLGDESYYIVDADTIMAVIYSTDNRNNKRVSNPEPFNLADCAWVLDFERDTVIDTIRTLVRKCDSIYQLKLTVNESPVIYSINGKSTILSGETAVLYADASEKGLEYVWSYNGKTQKKDTLRVNYSDINGNIDVTLTATNKKTKCSTESWITILYNVGIDDVENTSINIYPNPVAQFLNIESAQVIREAQIFNTIGQQVMAERSLGNQGSLNLGNLTRGNYTLRLVLDNGNTVVRKFVISK